MDYVNNILRSVYGDRYKPPISMINHKPIKKRQKRLKKFYKTDVIGEEGDNIGYIKKENIDDLSQQESKDISQQDLIKQPLQKEIKQPPQKDTQQNKEEELFKMD